MSSGPDSHPKYVGTGAHLTTTELKLWTSLLDASRILDTELEADLVANHEMSHREYEVLVRLDGWGGSLRMSDLARQIEASSPLVTQTVKRLQERGWVDRRPAQGDGRGVQATLLPAGQAALAAAAIPHAKIIRTLLLEWVDEDVDSVADALERVANHLRLHRAGQKCDTDGCPLNGSEHAL